MMDNRQDLVRQVWGGLRPEIEGLFATLWGLPELPAMEFQSSAILCEWLERHGLAVERGIGNVPTAFRARAGNGKGPRVGILAEYDALPNLGNDAVPYRHGNRSKPGH